MLSVLKVSIILSDIIFENLVGYNDSKLKHKKVKRYVYTAVLLFVLEKWRREQINTWQKSETSVVNTAFEVNDFVLKLKVSFVKLILFHNY
jgi:hypothetical protein